MQNFARRFLILCICIHLPAYAQYYSIKGNLIHIDARQKFVDISDTTGSWHDHYNEIEESSSWYLGAFRTDKELYLHYHSSTYAPYFGSNYFRAMEKFSNRDRFLYSGYWAQDNPFIFGITTGIYSIEDGFWLVDDTFGYAFVTHDDSITKRPDYYRDIPYVMVHIAGKINDKHLFYFWDFEGIGYSPYLVDLSDSPTIDSAHVYPVKLNNNKQYCKIQHVIDNQFLVNEDYKYLAVYQVENDSLIYNELLSDDFYSQRWIYRAPYIYCFQNSRLLRYTYESSSQILSEPDTLINLDYRTESMGIDVEFAYTAYIKNDSLYLYNIDSTLVTRSWDVSDVNNPRVPIIAYPDIFVHNTTSVTGIEQKETDVPGQFEVAVYPNPFNARLKIDIAPNIENNIYIDIYDILGRLVQNFEIRAKANQTVFWEPERHLSSGLYLLNIRGAQSFKIFKVIYLK